MGGLLLGGAILVAPLAGQSADRPSPEAGAFVSALAGLHPGNPGVHLFGGLEGGWSRLVGPLGVQGVGLLGGGAGFRSGFVGGGFSARAPLSHALPVRGWVGLGGYRESLSETPDAAPRTQGPALAMGVSGGVPLGPVGLRLGVLAWAGTVRGSGMRTEPRPVGLRFLLGVTP